MASSALRFSCKGLEGHAYFGEPPIADPGSNMGLLINSPEVEFPATLGTKPISAFRLGLFQDTYVDLPRRKVRESAVNRPSSRKVSIRFGRNAVAPVVVPPLPDRSLRKISEQRRHDVHVRVGARAEVMATGKPAWVIVGKPDFAARVLPS